MKKTMGYISLRLAQNTEIALSPNVTNLAKKKPHVRIYGSC